MFLIKMFSQNIIINNQTMMLHELKEKRGKNITFKI